jgi:methylisocitrate lyase
MAGQIDAGNLSWWQAAAPIPKPASGEETDPMRRPTTRLRALFKRGKFVYMPSVYHPLAGRMVQHLGFKAAYVGGYVTGGSLAVSEPLLTMDEQVGLAGTIARRISLPLVCDAGAGFGEPLHAMRTVEEFIGAGVAGIHIEDQLYPKRAHYHKYVAHEVPMREFTDKIRFACRRRDELDKDFVIIARSDTCRFHGLGEAIKRINKAATVGADLGLVFPRDHKETVQAPKRAKIPLVWVQSRGNRDGRPLYSNAELADMGYVACIDAITLMLAALDGMREALTEIRKTGAYTGLSDDRSIELRQYIENLIGLESFYAVEEATVERKKWGKR